MLIHLHAGNPAQVSGIPGLCHGHCQVRGFPVRHAIEPDCHEQSRQLIIRNTSRRRPFHEEFNGFPVKLLTEFLSRNHINNCHGSVSFQNILSDGSAFSVSSAVSPFIS